MLYSRHIFQYIGTIFCGDNSHERNIFPVERYVINLDNSI